MHKKGVRLHLDLERSVAAFVILSVHTGISDYLMT